MTGIQRAVEILKKAGGKASGGKRDAGGAAYDPAERSERTRRAWITRGKNAARRAAEEAAAAAEAAPAESASSAAASDVTATATAYQNVRATRAPETRNTYDRMAEAARFRPASEANLSVTERAAAATRRVIATGAQTVGYDSVTGVDVDPATGARRPTRIERGVEVPNHPRDPVLVRRANAALALAHEAERTIVRAENTVNSGVALNAALANGAQAHRAAQEAVQRLVQSAPTNSVTLPPDITRPPAAAAVPPDRARLSSRIDLYEQNGSLSRRDAAKARAGLAAGGAAEERVRTQLNNYEIMHGTPPPSRAAKPPAAAAATAAPPDRVNPDHRLSAGSALTAAADAVHSRAGTYNTHARAATMEASLARPKSWPDDVGGGSGQRTPESHAWIDGSSADDRAYMRDELFAQADADIRAAGFTTRRLLDHARNVNSFETSPLLTLRAEIGEQYAQLRTGKRSNGKPLSTNADVVARRKAFLRTLETAHDNTVRRIDDYAAALRTANQADGVRDRAGTRRTATDADRQRISESSDASRMAVNLTAQRQRSGRAAPPQSASSAARASAVSPAARERMAARRDAYSGRNAQGETARETAERDAALGLTPARPASPADAINAEAAARRRAAADTRRRAIASLQSRAFATDKAPARPAPNRRTGSVFKHAVLDFIAKARGGGASGGKRDAGGAAYDPAERSRRTTLAWKSRRRNAEKRRAAEAAAAEAAAAAPAPAAAPTRRRRRAATPEAQREAERRQSVVPSADADFDMEPFATGVVPAKPVGPNEPFESTRAPGVEGGTSAPAVDGPRSAVRVSVSAEGDRRLKAAYGADFDVKEMAKRAYGGYGWDVDVSISNVNQDGTFSLNITAPPPNSMQVTREFRKDANGKRYVYHAWQELPRSAQNQGSGTRVFYESLQEYDKMGIAYAKTTAGLSVGGYAWARMGFHAENPRSVAESAIRRLGRLTIANDPDGSIRRRMIADIIANQDKPLVTNFIAKLRNGTQEVGKELLLGSGFSGKMVFDKNHEDRKAFDAYAASKLKLKKPAPRSLSVSRFL